jgi:hypothetical protein
MTMNFKKTTRSRIGTALFPAVCGQAAYVMSVAATHCEEQTQPLSAQPDLPERTWQHMASVVLPVCKAILEGLGLTMPTCEISFNTLSAASISDSTVALEGLSCGPASLIAVISHVLGIPLRQDIAVTGHILSTSGEIGPVGCLDEKLQACLRHPDIEEFAYGWPYSNRESSAEDIVPGTVSRELSALESHMGAIDLTRINCLKDLLVSVFREIDLVRRMLARWGQHVDAQPCEGSRLVDVLDVLAGDMEPRFWTECRRLLITDKADPAKQLISDYVSAAVERNEYPKGIGHKAFTLVKSLPMHVHRQPGLYPLTDLSAGIKLAVIAGSSMINDAMLFLDSIRGLGLKDSASSKLPTFSASGLLDQLSSRLSDRAVALRINLPIMDARASFPLKSSTCSSVSDMLHEIVAFYMHILTVTQQADAIDPESATAEAVNLLTITFHSVQAAFEVASSAHRGGLLAVLDAVAKTTTDRSMKNYKNAVLTEHLSDLDHGKKVALTEEMVQRLNGHVPVGFEDKETHDLAERINELILAYVSTLSQWSMALQSKEN